MTVIVDVRRYALWTTWRAVPMVVVLRVRRWHLGVIEDALARRLWGAP